MICFHHSIDLDGWTSAAIVKQKFPDCKLLGFNYGQLIPEFQENEQLIFVDISFPMKVFKKLLDEKHDITWIDHHISAIKEYENCDDLILWGMRNTKKAACELTWEYYNHTSIPEAIRLLGMYDCFRHKGTKEELKVLEFQYAARAIASNPEEALFFITATKDDINKLLNDGKAIYKYLCVDAKLAYKLGFEISFHDDIQTNKKYKFICFNKERFNPINFGIDYHKEGYDGAACFHYLGDNKWSFSLYNDNGKLDVSRIAKQFGGASGFTTDNIDLFTGGLFTKK